MKQIFNRDALIAVALMAIVMVCLWAVLAFTSDTEALKTCSVARSLDVCALTIHP